MESQNKLFEAFKEAAAADEQTTFLAQDKLWGRIEQQLDKQETKKIRLFSFASIKYIAAALVVIAGIAVGWNQFFGVEDKQNEVIVQQDNTVPEPAKAAQPILSVAAENEPVLKPAPAKFPVMTTAGDQKTDDENPATEHIPAQGPHFSLEQLNTAPESFATRIATNTAQGLLEIPGQTEGPVAEKLQPAPGLPEARLLQLQGVIVDKAGVALANAKVSIPGTDKVVTSDARGAFTLAAPDTAQFIMVQSYGNETKYVKVADRHSYKIEISPDQSNVALLNDIARYNRSNGMQNLSSSPLSTTSMRQELASKQKQQTLFRPAPSADPLIIINGVPYAGKFADINSKHIKEVKILPEATARVLYGDRAKNGVIVITLKKGKTVPGQ